MMDKEKWDEAYGIVGRIKNARQDAEAQIIAQALEEARKDHLLISPSVSILLSDIESVLHDVSRIYCPPSLLPPGAKDSEKCGACHICRAGFIRDRLLASGIIDEMKKATAKEGHDIDICEECGGTIREEKMEENDLHPDLEPSEYDRM